MSSIFGPMGAPKYRGIAPEELMTSAFDQPLSIGSTFFDQAKGGVLESFGLGTAIREVMTPDALDMPQPGETAGQTTERLIRPSGTMSIGTAVGQAAGLQLNEQRALTEDQWKESPFYREGVPFDRGMTNERAAALADFYDAKKVREFYAEKRPVTAFFGNLGGQALDPINYIPIAGPAVKAAAVLRFGKIGGAILTSAADAALNTGIASVLTAPDRAQFGDDVSWQATVSQIATAALIGGAFGGILGKVEAFRDSRAIARAQASLETLKRVQESRIALNDAVQGLAMDGEVKLGGTSLDLTARAAGDVDRLTALPPAREGDIGAGAAPTLADDVEAAFRDEVFQQSPDLQARFSAAEDRFTKAQARVSELEAPLTGRRESDAVALIDQQSGERLRAVEDEIAAKPPAARRAELEAERQLIVESIGPDAVAKAENDFRIGPEKKLKSAQKSLAAARREFSAARSEVRTAAEGIRSERAGRFTEAARSPATPRPLHEPTPEAAAAGERAARPEMTPEIAEAARVNPETGEFPEQADVDFLRGAGRLMPEEEAAIVDADKALEIGSAYGDAMKAAVRCML